MQWLVVKCLLTYKEYRHHLLLAADSKAEHCTTQLQQGGATSSLSHFIIGHSKREPVSKPQARLHVAVHISHPLVPHLAIENLQAHYLQAGTDLNNRDLGLQIRREMSATGVDICSHTILALFPGQPFRPFTIFLTRCK